MSINVRKLNLALAAQKLGALRTKLEQRAESPDVGTAELHQIALQLPLIAEQRRELQRMIVNMDPTHLPAPNEADIKALSVATETLSNGIATNCATTSLLGFATDMFGKASTLYKHTEAH